MKTCVRCGPKPDEDFFPGQKMPKVLCMACSAVREQRYYANKKANPVAWKNERERCRKKSAAYRASGYYQKWCEANRARIREKRKEYYYSVLKKEPHKKAAREKAFRAVRSGKIKESFTCQKCGVWGDLKLHMHHPDYSRPLDVIWLCTLCHGGMHRKPDPK